MANTKHWRQAVRLTIEPGVLEAVMERAEADGLSLSRWTELLYREVLRRPRASDEPAKKKTGT